MAQTVKQFDFELTQQQSHDITVDFYDADNLPRVLTGYDFKLDCKINVNQPDVILSLSSAAGQITVDGTNTNQLHLLVDHNMSKGLNFIKGTYDLVMYDAAKTVVEVILTGTISLNKTITRLV
jgi:hypothetical protein